MCFDPLFLDMGFNNLLSRREQGSRVVAQLLTLMDGNKSSSKSLPHVVVVASTNRLGLGELNMVLILDYFWCYFF